MLRRFVVAATLTAAFMTPTTASAQSCYAPQWQSIAKSNMGLAIDVAGTVEENYFIYQDEVGIQIEAKRRGQTTVSGRCSSIFRVDVIDFPGRHVKDTKSLFDREERAELSGIDGARKVSSRSLTVQGYPARDFSYRFPIPFDGGYSTRRLLIVVRDSRLYTFTWAWDGADAAPSDAERMFNSIRFITPVMGAHDRSTALLDYTIKNYWLYRDPTAASPGKLAPALRRIADTKLTAETKIVQGFGGFETPQFLRIENGYKVFRIKHWYATVDWYMKDDGKQITDLYWKKQ